MDTVRLGRARMMMMRVGEMPRGPPHAPEPILSPIDNHGSIWQACPIGMVRLALTID